MFLCYYKTLWIYNVRKMVRYLIRQCLFYFQSWKNTLAYYIIFLWYSPLAELSCLIYKCQTRLRLDKRTSLVSSSMLRQCLLPRFHSFAKKTQSCEIVSNLFFKHKKQGCEESSTFIVKTCISWTNKTFKPYF